MVVVLNICIISYHSIPVLCRTSLLTGTHAFAANDPWSALEDHGSGPVDGHVMSVDQIRQQQQQIIAGLFSMFVHAQMGIGSRRIGKRLSSSFNHIYLCYCHNKCS